MVRYKKGFRDCLRSRLIFLGVMLHSQRPQAPLKWRRVPPVSVPSLPPPRAHPLLLKLCPLRVSFAPATPLCRQCQCCKYPRAQKLFNWMCSVTALVFTVNLFLNYFIVPINLTQLLYLCSNIYCYIYNWWQLILGGFLHGIVYNPDVLLTC